jgi:hypothetical protein
MRGRLVVGIVGAASAAALTAPGLAATSHHAQVSFSKPIKLTINKYFGGYEPGLVTDRYGNVIVTAHKQNHGDGISPDGNSPESIRSASWVWRSSDGRHFTDMPGLTPVDEQSLEFGDEGDLAFDDAHHLYFVDTNVADDTVTRWTVAGNGKFHLDLTRPVGPFAEPVDDRPWVVAHGNGTVMYFGNEGDKGTYPLGSSPLTKGRGNGVGPGRYTVYVSHNGARSFDPIGVTLKDSGWCRPAADHRRGSHTVVVVCGDDGKATAVQQNVGNVTNPNGTLYAYVTHDDGTTWHRYRIGKYDAVDPWSTWPSVSIARDGTVFAMYIDHPGTPVCPFAEDQMVGCPDPKHTRITTYTSHDLGRHWSSRVVLDTTKGQSRYGWSDIARDGTLGIAYYYRPSSKSDWFVYAGTAKPGQPFHVVKASPNRVASSAFPYAFGDFFEAAFDRNNKLNIVYTSQNTDLVAEGLNTDIYYVRQR